MPSPSSNLPRPGRVLTIFLVAVVALFVILGIVSLGSGGGGGTWKPRLGLDLQGGTRITLQAKSSSGDVPADKLNEAAGIIEQRVNGSGVSEAEVSTQGGDQIITEIPGEQSQDLVDTVTRTAQLRFRLVWGGQTAKPAKGKKAQQSLAAAKKAAGKVDWTKLSIDQMIKAETDGVASLPKPYQGAVKALQQGTNAFACTTDSLTAIKDDPNAPLITCDKKTGEVFLLSPAAIEGTDLNSAAAVIPQRSVEWVVNLELGGDGKTAFDKVTKALHEQQLQGNQAQSRFAIVLDGTVLSAPTSQAHITDGNSQISGGFTQASAQSLSNSLKYGALPLTFKVNGVSVEGPSLAGVQLQAGIVAGIVGLLLVVVYSLFYYRGLGLVAIASLSVAGVIAYAMVLLLGKGMNFTLTLPGIAGLIVAIGITADSFIVFFERLRDEVREGKSLRLAVEAGWRRARTTILAADAVSFLAALVLYIFAIGVVRGFAFALGLTTLIDVFVVFFFTKPLISLLARTKFYGEGHKLSGFDAAHLGIKGRRITEVSRRPASATTRTSATTKTGEV